MKNIFALLLLFSACISNAQQNTLNNVGLTNLTPASVAFSVRQLSSTYTGPLVRIKVGTSFYDVYPDASTKFFSLNSNISAPIGTYNAAVALASSNSLSSIILGTTEATVAIWYDQSGNGVNVLTSVATGPKIITQGSIQLMSGKPSIYFAAVSAGTSPLVSNTTVNYSAQQTATVNAVAQNVGSTNYISGIYSTGLSGGWGLNYDPTASAPGFWLDGSGCNQAFSGATSTTPKIVTGFLNKSTNSSMIYENSVLKGTKTMTCNIANGTADNICIGIRASNGGTRKFDGYISEVILFPSILSSADQGTLESNQNATYFSPNVIITSSATNNTSCAGASITFTATPYNFSTTPSYQWYKNSVAINGATSATYTTTALSNNDVINVMAVEGSASVTTNGLVMNLDAGNPSSYTGSTTTWTDLTGNGNNGAITSGITYNAANGGYFQFPSGGSVGGIVLPASSNDFNFTTGDFAVELWVNAYNNQARLISLNTTSNVSSTALTIFPVATTGYPLYAGSLTTNGFTWSIWHHVVYTRISSIVSLYVDGVLKATATDASNLPSNGATTSNTLGSFVATSNYLSYTGKMSIARVYKAAGLTSSQVVSNYNAICSRYSLNPIGINSNSITTTITAGPSATLTVLGDGCINKTTLSTTSGQTSYTWYKDGGAISGATNNTYKPTTAGEYKVQVLNGTCATMSTLTTISTCGVTASGRMSILETSTTLVSKAGAKNNGKGVSERGKILNQPSPPLITTGLQLHYDAGNVSSYSNPSATWNDISGNTGRNATFVNSPTFNTGNGGSIYTNGLDQYAQSSYTGSATDSYTFSAWFKNDNYSEPKYILGRGRDGAGNGWSLQLQVSTGGIVTAGVVPTVPSTIGIVANGTSTLALNTWYYITAVWTAGQSIKVYVNGSLEGTTTLAGTSLRTSTNGWWIGSISTTIFTSGYNAVAQVYNSVLSEAQILQNFNADKTRFGY